MSKNVQRLSIPIKSNRPSLSDFISSSDDSDSTQGYSTRGSTNRSETTRVTSLQIPGKVSNLDNSIDADIDLSQYKLIDKNSYILIPKNSRILYIKNSGKKIQNKYFKGYDKISDGLIIGFYTHDKRNYTEKVSNINQLFTSVDTNIEGGTKNDLLKGTIELSDDKWKSLNRDTIVSYQKTNGEWVYKAKFNAFVKSNKDQSTRMSMTSEKGFSFIVNPDNISKMYRHISSNDKTLTFILQNLKQLEQQFHTMEKKIKHIDTRLTTIEHRIRK